MALSSWQRIASMVLHPLFFFFFLSLFLTWTGCCTPTQQIFKKRVPLRIWSTYLFSSIRVEVASCASVASDSDNSGCLSCWMNFLTIMGTLLLDIFPQRAMFACNCCLYLTVVQVNNERVECYCLHCCPSHAQTPSPTPYTRGSRQGKVQFLAHYCLCSLPSGLGSLSMMDVVSDRLSCNTDKAALSKHIHQQCKQIKIVADN